MFLNTPCVILYGRQFTMNKNIFVKCRMPNLAVPYSSINTADSCMHIDYTDDAQDYVVNVCTEIGMLIGE